MTIIRDHLIALYGEALGLSTFQRVRQQLDRFSASDGVSFRGACFCDEESLARQAVEPAVAEIPHFVRNDTAQRARRVLTQCDAILITYGDQLRAPNAPPLRTLAEFCNRHLAGVVSGLHVLPFYPSSSDDGFSVIDYTQVDPVLGDWAEVARLGAHFDLMFDAVINHISAKSAWFQAFLRDEAPYRNYFIVVEGDPDLSQVVRPRALPLLTTFVTPPGEKRVWTTFSADQIDLDYHNPDVLVAVIDVLLDYVSHGAQFIRLDAIAYLWKEIGTCCIHLPQTHRVIQLLRAVLDEVAPQVTLITEANVPHEDNVSYFGDGHNEAQLVYNFALPPLILHTFQTGDARALSKWAASLLTPGPSPENEKQFSGEGGKPLPLSRNHPSDFGRGGWGVRGEVAFFNFLASHDGIGLNPARGLLSDAEIAVLVDRAVAHGGLISYKRNTDGSHSPYELNINYFDALSDPKSDEPLDTQIDRFVAAHAIMLALSGVPGLYFHSLFGSRGWPAGVMETGQNRTINRQKFDRAEMERELGDSQSRRARVFARLKRLLEVRATSAAFAPHSPQDVLHFQDIAGEIRSRRIPMRRTLAMRRALAWGCQPTNSPVMAVLRGSGDEQVLCLHNVSAQPQVIQLEREWAAATDLITARTLDGGAVTLAPYQVVWLKQIVDC
jgi:glucosylglycerate phosphorylase